MTSSRSRSPRTQLTSEGSEHTAARFSSARPADSALFPAAHARRTLRRPSCQLGAHFSDDQPLQLRRTHLAPISSYIERH